MVSKPARYLASLGCLIALSVAMAALLSANSPLNGIALCGGLRDSSN
jgi:hypothetical protein